MASVGASGSDAPEGTSRTPSVVDLLHKVWRLRSGRVASCTAASARKLAAQKAATVPNIIGAPFRSVPQTCEVEVAAQPFVRSVLIGQTRKASRRTCCRRLAGHRLVYTLLCTWSYSSNS